MTGEDADLPDEPAVTLGTGVLGHYPRFSLYNSPYPAHDAGCAVDLYPGTDDAPSPVAGAVLDTRVVSAPPKPYAAPDEHLILVDTGSHVARILHVEPVVEAGDHVAVGDTLGRLVRSGFFAPWVANHVHLGFRRHDQNAYRATGSLPVDVDVAVDPVHWDGTGTVVERGETYVVLDSPTHPAPGERFVGLAADDGTVLDGGFVHYRGGGALTTGDGDAVDDGASTSVRRPPLDGSPRHLSLFGVEVGVAHGRTVSWADLAVHANGRQVTGLSLFAARDADFGAKVVCPNHSFAVGDEVRVTLDSDGDPIHLSSG